MNYIKLIFVLFIIINIYLLLQSIKIKSKFLILGTTLTIIILLFLISITTQIF